MRPWFNCVTDLCNQHGERRGVSPRELETRGEGIDQARGFFLKLYIKCAENEIRPARKVQVEIRLLWHVAPADLFGERSCFVEPHEVTVQ